jgi:DDE superfamily endonuclease
MRTLPTTIVQVLAPFAPLFSERVFEHVQLLLAGAILTPGKWTVASARRAVGPEQERRFCRYHRVLSRAVWSSREVSGVLLGLLVEAFVAEGPLVVGIDETLERRRGKKICAKGIYRDPVRSSREHFVKTSALRWVCLALLTPVPWASRVWSLPFLSALAYSERYAQEQGKRHKSLTEWAWQLLRRWYPEREIVAVAETPSRAFSSRWTTPHAQQGQGRERRPGEVQPRRGQGAWHLRRWLPEVEDHIVRLRGPHGHDRADGERKLQWALLRRLKRPVHLRLEDTQELDGLQAAGDGAQGRLLARGELHAHQVGVAVAASKFEGPKRNR